MEFGKLCDSDLKIMDLIWENEPLTAKEVSLLAGERFGWNKNTSYTIIKKLIDKEFVARTEPNFVCHSLIKKDVVQKAETKNLLSRMYQGSKRAFFASFFENEKLSQEELEELKELIDRSSDSNAC